MDKAVIAPAVAASSDPAPDAAVAASSIHDMLAERARRTPNSVLFLAPGRSAGLTCDQLLRQSEHLVQTLNGWNLGRGDRVATFLGGGPETAALMLAITCAASYAPISPKANQSEVGNALADLKVKAVVLRRGEASAGRAAAAARNIPVIELSFDPDSPAGTISLTCDRPPPANPNPRTGFAAPDDAFYVLQTSGTTARPKVVPLAQRKFCAAVSQNIRVLQTGPADRGLHVLSMSHVMGITTVVYSLMAGAQVVYAPAFEPAEFFPLVREFRPTWFTAPPAIHQSVIRRAAEHLDYLRHNPPRFVRAGAAPLPVSLLNEIERVWNAPMVEAYAMSECPMISSNHAPPGRRRPGSVGLPCGVDVALLDESGKLLPLAPGREGEIAVRGPHVMDGYDDNPAANAEAFLDGWFRTGDLGHFDDDGFLFYTGRRKEMINRGGVKIAPREIDEVVLAHPAIADAITFALPDARLGEDVAVAAVLKPGAAASELDIRQHAAMHLSEHKTPRRVVFLDQIPAGPMGKPQRIGLATKLGLDQPAAPHGPAAYRPPRNALEEALTVIWEQVLHARDPIGIDDNFLDLGGDSVQAVAMFAEVKRLLARDVPVGTLIAAPTVAQLADVMSRDSAAAPAPGSCVVPIQPRGSRPPLFCLPGMHGHVFNFYPLARHLGRGQPLYGLQLPLVYDSAPTAAAQSIEQLAALFVREICAVRPTGPYQLAGYSFGGYVGYEVAQQLLRAGHDVAMLAVFDTRGPGYPRRLPPWPRAKYHLRKLLPPREGVRYVSERLRHAIRRFRPASPAASPAPTSADDFIEPEHPSVRAARAYTAVPYPGRLTLFAAAEQPSWLAACVPDPTMGWGRLAREVDVRPVPGNHVSMLTSAHAKALAAVVASCLLPEPQGPEYGTGFD